MAKYVVKDPVILADAVREHGVSRKWLRVRINKGEIRCETLPNGMLALERPDVEKLVPARKRVEKILAERRQRLGKKGVGYT